MTRTPSLPAALAALPAALAGLRGGRLHLTLPDGARHVLGEDGPEADLVLRDGAALALLRRPGLEGLGHAHALGLCDTGAIEPLAALWLRNGDLLARRLRPGMAARPLAVLRKALGRTAAVPPLPGNEFFMHWLDPGMDGTSGRFVPGDGDLGRAQARKQDGILHRLAGDDLLEIGCGWGAFAERAAEQGRRVTATAATGPQRAWADARLDGRARVVQGAVAGRFAHVVAIEPQVADWTGFLAQAEGRLAEGGSILVQAVTRPVGEGEGDGAALPGPMAAAAAAAGLRPAVIGTLGADAAQTRRLWAARLAAAGPRLRRHGFDAPMLRHWQFRLESAAARFALGLRDVVQVSFTRA